MCVNCLSHAEALAAQLALATAVLKEPVHRLLTSAGLVDPPDVIARDVETIAFLRALDLDPVAVLGPEIVSAACMHRPQVQVGPVRRRRRPLAIAG